MKLTIGMATYDDYDGVYFTIQALRTYHPEVMEQVELIVVDNNPGTKTSEYIQCLLDKWCKGVAGAKYVPMSSPKGTTQPRNRIFEEATGNAVLVIDSHVLIAPGVIEELLAYYSRHPDTRDLLSGPILYDDFTICGDHFADVWRSEMWGIWAKGWTCCSTGPHFFVTDNHGECSYRLLQMEPTPIQECCPNCGITYRPMAYSGHDTNLINAGFHMLADTHNPPFEIPGMGLGLFSCRREAWLGFNQHFRGFGGEEMYIHEKYRQAGAKCLCLPFLRWGHRFGRPNGTPYSNVTAFHKVRNYILGHQELGLPLDRLYQHFIVEKRLGKGQWYYLMDDPIMHDAPYFPPGFVPPKNSGPLDTSLTMQTILQGTGEP